MIRAAALLSSCLSCLASAVFSPALAVEPARGPDPRIAVWKYNRLQSLDVVSVGCALVNVVLEPGETVLIPAASGVFPDRKAAEQHGGWHMPFNAFAKDGGNAGDGKKGEPVPTLVRDQVILQPTKCDAAPVVLQLMTYIDAEGREGERYPYVLVLHTVKEAPEGGKVPYQQIQVQRVPKSDPAALAASAAARRQRQDEWRSRQMEARLMAAQAPSPAPIVAGDWEYAPGASSPQGCDFVGPAQTPEVRAGQTVLTFDPRQQPPQVYTRTPSGEPTLVRPVPAIRPDGWTSYTLPGTYPQLWLVNDKQVCAVRYNGFNRRPEPNTTGTVSAEVRVVPR